MIDVRYERGIYLPAQDLWLDAWEAKRFAFVSHAHSDHLAPHKEIVLSERTARLMQARMPGTRMEHVLPFCEQRRVRDVDLTLLPAGHIFGSAQLFLANQTETLLYTGDFKLRRGKSAEPAEWREADTLIMETTFGLPRYQFPPTEKVIEQIVAFCRDAIEENAVPVLLGYSLGKAQEILCSLDGAGLTPMLHGSVFQMTRIYEQFGQVFCKYVRYNKNDIEGKVLICPPSASHSPMVRKNSAAARSNDQRLGGGAERDLSLSGRRCLSPFRSRGLQRSASICRTCETETRFDVARFCRRVRPRLARTRNRSMGFERREPDGIQASKARNATAIA